MPLERLEEELYRSGSEEIEKRRKSKAKATPRTVEPLTEPSWQEESPESDQHEEGAVMARLSSLRKWLLGGAIGIAFVLFVVAGFYFYLGLTARGVVLEIESDDEVVLGVPFTVALNYANNSRSVLRDARVGLTLPEGIILLSDDEHQKIVNRTLGDVGVGSQGKAEFELIALQNPQSVKRLEASLDYIASQLGSRFERTVSKTLVIGEPALRVDLSAPERVLSGEEFEIKVDYENTSAFAFGDLELRFEYPPLFHFGRSSIPGTEGNFLWRTGELRSGSFGEIIIRGSAIGKAETFFEVPLSLSITVKGKKYVLEQKSARVQISPSPLSLEVLANGKTDYIAGPGERLDYIVSYQNNTDVNLRDVVLQVRLTGEMFDMATLSTNGFLNSITNTLTWNAANSPAFQSLSAGESGTITFSINTKSAYPIRRLSDKNFTLRAEATLESPTVPPTVAAAKTVSITDNQVKVRGKIDIAAKALFRDAASGILNSGPFPPRVNVPTHYTVHWAITNYSTDVENIEIRAYLQAGVRFTGMTKSNISSIPTYNERTQEVTWKIDRALATKGVISDPIEAVFQIEATPSIAHTGQFMPLLSQTELRAKDAFTGLDLIGVAQPLTTFLIADSTVNPNQGIVVQ